MLVLIDNYDSFTYNVALYFRELDIDVKVIKNDEMSPAEVMSYRPSHLVISPGPCSPNEAGISIDLIRQQMGRLPILGICLGHQAIAQVCGAQVVQAESIIHGKTSDIHHQQQGVFESLPSPFKATRYHSLSVSKTTLPAELEITAWTLNNGQKLDQIMGLRHRQMKLEGVQFHPESVLSEHGHELFKNFLQYS